jgi:hypothetical protein
LAERSKAIILWVYIFASALDHGVGAFGVEDARPGIIGETIRFLPEITGTRYEVTLTEATKARVTLWHGQYPS